jgi:hypothetical protein
MLSRGCLSLAPAHHIALGGHSHVSNKSIHYITEAVQLLAPASYTSTQTSTSFDREKGISGDKGAPYEALEFLIDVGAWTSGTFTFTLQDSPDNSTFTAVTAANEIGTFTVVSSAGTASTIYRMAYVGTQRYVQVVATGATTPSAVFGIIAVPGYPRNLPTVASGT